MEKFFNPIAKGSHRNKACICGSGIKAKKCHGAKSLINKEEYQEYNEIILIHNVAMQRMLNEQANKS